jgi:surface antigen
MRGLLPLRGLFAAATSAAMLVAAPLGASAGLLDYVGQCVPFAREASGIRIFGDAWTWWGQAEGKYDRGHAPRVGSVIVFAKTSRLPLGHVAVVSRVVERRVLMLTHANWSRQNGERGHAEQDVTLYDVSDDNDWSTVKVWFRDADGLGGSIYPVQGFIYGGRPSPQLTSRNPDYVGALIDAYVPGAGR